jgi:hypothetical protein
MLARERRWLGPLAAAALAASYALCLLVRGSPYDLDRASFFLPYNRIYRDALAAGQLPLWSPDIWGGYPVHAEGQGGFFSPLRWVGLLASDEVAGLDLELAALLILAALAGALGARLLFAPGPAAEALAGLVWSLGGGMLAVQENPAMQGSFLVLPLALGLAYRGRLVGLALALAWAILSGYPYGPALIVLACAPLVLWPPDGAARPERVRVAALALGVAVLLGAIQWLPTAELLQHSDRWGGMTGEQLTQAGVRPTDLAWLVSPVYPAAVRHSADSGLLAYLGLPVVLLAGWGAWRFRAERPVAYLGGLALAALALALLLSSPLGQWVARLPGVGMVRGPNKLYFLVGGAAALLSARGVAGLRRPVAAWALVVLVTLDLGSYGLRRAILVDRDALRAAPRLAELCRDGRVYVGQVPLVWGRELPADATEAASFLRQSSPLDANHGVRWGVSHLAGYGPLQPRRAVEAWRAPSLALLQRASASHYVARPGFEAPTDALPIQEATPRWTLCRVAGSLAPVRVAAAVALADSQQEALRLLPEQDPGRMVVEGDFEVLDPALLNQAPGAAGVVELGQWGPGQIELDLNLDRPAVVLITDAWFPGWEALLDGVEVPLLVGDALWKAAPIPAGRGRLTLVYRPWSVRWGAALSLLGMVCLVCVTIRRRRAHLAGQSVDEASAGGLGSPPDPLVSDPPRGADHDPHP